jgi:hypothetical protein
MVTISLSRRDTTVDSFRLKDVIRSNILTLCQTAFPAGRQRYGEWQVGNTAGDTGDSLGIRLVGPKTNLWLDRATGEGDDFIELLRAKFGFGFKEAVEWIKRTLAISLQSAEAGERKECGPGETQIVRQPELAPEPRELSTDELRRMAAAAHRLAIKPELFYEVLGPRPGIGLDAVRGSALDGDLGYEADCQWFNLSGAAILFGYSRGIKARWHQPPAGKRPMRWLAGRAGGECWRQSLLRRSHCAHRKVYITEGETDALALLSLGVEDRDEHCLVVGLPGATTLPKPEPFGGLEVIIVPDTDGPGQASARKLAELLSASARVSIANLAGGN